MIILPLDGLFRVSNAWSEKLASVNNFSKAQPQAEILKLLARHEQQAA
jgi:hypothetical protein